MSRNQNDTLLKEEYGYIAKRGSCDFSTLQFTETAVEVLAIAYIIHPYTMFSFMMSTVLSYHPPALGRPDEVALIR